MSVVFYRIDDRLIHGQVMTAWSKLYKANKIIIVDNDTVKNDFLVQIMKMSAPKEIDVKVCTNEEGLEAILNDSPESRTIVHTKTPDIMLYLLENGAPMKELNLGGMGYKAGRKMILRNIQVNSEELDQLKKIASHDVHVFCQIVPDGKKIELDKVKL